ncbi:MAG: hypothetical protein MUF43_13820 [Flavobacterium sp.]|jgi:hypothetical protein|nr:hypothetical protein [Flavobacterium sp.]
MKKLTYIFLALATLISLAVFTACNKEGENSNSKNKLASAKQTYNTNTDPEPFICCFTGEDEAKGKYWRDPLESDCDLSGKCFKLVPEHDPSKPWWVSGLIRSNDYVSPNILSADEYIADYELLDKNTLLIKIKEFGHKNLEDLYQNSTSFNVSKTSLLKYGDLVLEINKGNYPIYFSEGLEYKSIIKINVKIQD